MDGVPASWEEIGHLSVNHSKEFVNYKEIVILPEKDVATEILLGQKKHPCHIQTIESK